MSQTHPGVRQGDPAIKWFILGGVAAMIPSVVFLMYLTDAVREAGPSGAMALLGMGVAFCGAIAAVVFGPVGRAIGKRILGGGQERQAIDEDLHDLRLQVDDLRNALAESQERIEFTERLLAGGKDRVAEELH